MDKNWNLLKILRAAGLHKSLVSAQKFSSTNKFGRRGRLRIWSSFQTPKKVFFFIHTFKKVFKKFEKMEKSESV